MTNDELLEIARTADSCDDPDLWKTVVAMVEFGSPTNTARLCREIVALRERIEDLEEELEIAQIEVTCSREGCSARVTKPVYCSDTCDNRSLWSRFFNM